MTAAKPHRLHHFAGAAELVWHETAVHTLLFTLHVCHNRSRNSFWQPKCNQSIQTGSLAKHQMSSNCEQGSWAWIKPLCITTHTRSSTLIWWAMKQCLYRYPFWFPINIQWNAVNSNHQGPFGQATNTQYHDRGPRLPTSVPPQSRWGGGERGRGSKEGLNTDTHHLRFLVKPSLSLRMTHNTS